MPLMSDDSSTSDSGSGPSPAATAVRPSLLTPAGGRPDLANPGTRPSLTGARPVAATATSNTAHPARPSMMISSAFAKSMRGIMSGSLIGGSSHHNRNHQNDDDESSSGFSSTEEDSHELEARKGSQRSLNSAKQYTKYSKKDARSRVGVILVYLLVAAGVSAATYGLLRYEEIWEFEQGFHVEGREFLSRVQVTMNTLAGRLLLMAQDVTLTTKGPWPLVTNSKFEARGLLSGVVSPRGAWIVGLSPILHLDTTFVDNNIFDDVDSTTMETSSATRLSQWEQYAVNHQDWLDESRVYQQVLLQNPNPLFLSTGQVWQPPDTGSASIIPDPATDIPNITAFVYRLAQDGITKILLSNDNPLPSMILPVWQLAPAPLYDPSIVNYNLLDWDPTALTRMVDEVRRSQQPAMSPAMDLSLLVRGSLPSQLQQDQQQQLQEPQSLYMQPLWDHLAPIQPDPRPSEYSDRQRQLQQAQDDTSRPPTVVGILHAVIPWSSWLGYILPQRVHGMVVVVHVTDTCAPTGAPPRTQDVFTYTIDGPEAIFVGYGDYHDSAYDDLVEWGEVNVPQLGPTTVDTSSNSTQCLYQFSLYIYPSKELQDTLYNRPIFTKIMYGGLIIVVFFVAITVFTSYSYLVALRQKKVVESAKRSNQIVANLFPANVRERIMKEAEEQAAAEVAQMKQNRGRSMKKIFDAEDDSNSNANGKSGSKQTATDLFGPMTKLELKAFLVNGSNNGAIAAPETSNMNGGDGELNDNDDLTDSALGDIGFAGKPIADLFPSATVLFCDLVGFTAWSSVREPTQVFQLLETLYNAFDQIANRRRVFKVETIGDCYVAVCGLPEPRKDHAVVMARFSREVLAKMNDLCQKLEVVLGPDTGDLGVRIGLNSGPVTAGVLRGDKSRFQLYGETVNTAGRMESTGAKNRIHMSEDTAYLLKSAGKEHWYSAREDKIVAKGTGETSTYWLETSKKRHGPSSAASDEERTSKAATKGDGRPGLTIKLKSKMAVSTSSRSLKGLSSHHNRSGMTDPMTSKQLTPEERRLERLVSWNVDILMRLLKQIVARRNGIKKKDALLQAEEATQIKSSMSPSDRTALRSAWESSNARKSQRVLGSATVLDEVVEIIELPQFEAQLLLYQDDPNQLDLGSSVKNQLYEFVTEIAKMYRYNPFHNFDHASHVIMSVVKLLSRIVAPDAVVGAAGERGESTDHLIEKLHDHTYGITSDPMTQFSVVFSALIHDVDHPGVPNQTLINEKTGLAELYRNKSIAEQNSVDLAWDVLMKSQYKALRESMCETEAERRRFRQLVVNTVMATDIVDKELKALRDDRWKKAFVTKEATEKCEVEGGESTNGAKLVESERDDVNRKATIVIEHIIQASDVAHTMQHWHIYQKWNERFFEEMYAAYSDGRSEKDPSEFWYKGEIGFFDFYIIPLAKKLKDCGVFGVSSDEYLQYAQKNREEWEAKGQEVVARLVEKYCKKSKQEEAPPKPSRRSLRLLKEDSDCDEDSNEDDIC